VFFFDPGGIFGWVQLQQTWR